jgi:hypothetical protein
MPTTLDPLILDLVEWLAKEPRSYGEVMEAWRTSCPRLTVWEDAVDRGLVARAARGGSGALVTVTAEGMAFLRENGRSMGGPPMQDWLQRAEAAE